MSGRTGSLKELASPSAFWQSVKISCRGTASLAAGNLESSERLGVENALKPLDQECRIAATFVNQNGSTPPWRSDGYFGARGRRFLSQDHESLSRKPSLKPSH
jgi:hypothetical protein